MPNFYKILLTAFVLALFAESYAQCGYSFRKEISVNNSQVAGTSNLTDFPMLFSVTDNDLRSTANGGGVTNSDGYDIMFVTEFGEPIAHQLEYYDETTGNVVAWLKVPLLYAEKNTNLYIYYGNSAILTDPSTNKVWDNNYQAVWHLHDDLNDGTEVGNDMTNNGSVDITGKIGDGQSFDGSNDFLDRTDANLNGNIPSLSSGSPDEFTLSGWIYLDAINARRPLLSKQGIGPGTDRGFVFMMEDDNRLKAELFKNNVSGDRTEVYSTANLAINTWYYITMTYEFVTDGTSVVFLYINGANDGSTTTSVGPIVANSRDLDIGRYYWNGSTQYYLDGIIDEVRISDVVRSADWVATEYNNQNDPSAFFSTGAQEGGSYTPVIPNCGYAFQKVITIDSDSVYGSTSHTDFPLLISLSDNDLRTEANGGNVKSDNGFDIIFTDSNLIPLDFQIETYDASSGDYVAWVRLPSLPTNQDLKLNMFYGTDNAFANPSTNCTWSADYEGVWHLHDDFLDASSNAVNATNNGSADESPAKIADGQSFDGTDFLELSSFPNLTTNFTISGWINTTDNTEAGQRIFCDDESNTGGYALSLGDGGTGRLRFYSRSMSGVILDGPTNTISNNTWYYVVGVADITNQDRYIYVNGTAIASDLTDGGTWGTDNGDASIGGETNSGETGNRFEGLLDEIRVAGVARSADWLKTEFSNQNWPDDFYSVGSEIALNVTSNADGDWDQTGTWVGGVVPGEAANVTINHNVDLDDRDEKICNLIISNENNNTVSFEIQNGQYLEVVEDVILEGNDDTGAEDVTLRLSDNSSKLRIGRNLYVNQLLGDDNFIDLEDTDDSLIVAGDMFIEHRGSDQTEIRLDDADAVISINGDLFANVNAGADDLLEFDLNAGNLIINGTFVGTRSNNFGDIELDMDGGHFTSDSFRLSSTTGGGSENYNILVDEASILTVNGDMILENAAGDDFNLYINNNGGTDGQLIVNGDLLVNKSGGDDLNIIVDDANSVFTVTGDLIINSTGGEEVDINMDNGSFNVNGLMHIIDSNNATDLFHLDMDGGIMTIDSLVALQSANANKDLLIDLDNGAIINAGYFTAELVGQAGNEEILIDIDGTSQMNVTNDVLIIATTGNDLEFHLGENVGASTAQLNVNGNMTLDHNGASGVDDIQFIISENSIVDVDGGFTMQTDGSGGAGNFYTRINDNSRLTVGSNITMDNSIGSGYLEIELNNDATLQIGGNFVRNSSPNDFGLVQSNSATTTIEYNGTNAQIFADEDGAGTDGIEYELVVINNSFGTEPQLTMEAPVTLTNSITFTDGVLQTTSVNKLSLADGATANTGSANSFVSGPFSKIGDDDFIFPLGQSGNWAPLAISNLQNGPAATDEFTAEYFRSTFSESFLDSADYAGDPGGMHNTSIVEYWDLARDNGNTEPQVSLYWSNNDSSFIDDTMDLVVAHYIGGNTWVNEGGAASGLVTSGNVRSLNNISSFSVFTFGSVSSALNPLPIELLDFTARAENDVVVLEWKTLSEINNALFTVQRTKDNVTFEDVANITGAGDSRELLEYSTTDDDPHSGLSYYRLKQTDFDGSFSYSKLVPVNFNDNSDFFVYPNPSKNGKIFFSEPISGQIFDGYGRLILEFETTIEVSTLGFASGLYYLKANNRDAVSFSVE